MSQRCQFPSLTDLLSVLSEPDLSSLVCGADVMRSSVISCYCKYKQSPQPGFFFICHYYAVSSQSPVYLSELLILERGQNATPNILTGSGHCYFVFLLQRTPSMGRVTAVTIGWTGTQKNIQTVKVGFPLDS